jgi:transcriptional regulator with XRE-family HTH domain
MQLIEIGSRIRCQRKKIGMTQTELAERLNISPQAISKWELGLNAPDIMLLPSLAAILNLSIDQLLGYDLRSSHIVQGSVLVGRVVDYFQKILTAEPEHTAVYINTICYSVTERAIINGGTPITFYNGYLLFVFIGINHSERAVNSAVEIVKLKYKEDKASISVGLSAGQFYHGPIGHPDFSRIAAVGPPVVDAIKASIWAERYSESRFGVTREFMKQGKIPGRTKGPIPFELDGQVLQVYEVRPSLRG